MTISDLDVEFHHVAELAKRLDRGIAIFDLETTTFRGSPDFGIMEVCCFLVQPSGIAVTYGHLINPERPISDKARELTGITQEMVADKELWSKRYAKHFKELAKNFWLSGFNIKSFDLHAVRDMNERYGEPIERFDFVFDIRNLHLNLAESKSQKGSMKEIAQLYGVAPKGDVHRAKADVIMAVETLDRIIDLFGLEEVVAAIEAPQPKNEGKLQKTSSLNPQAIAQFVKGREKVSVTELAEAFNTDERKIGFELGRAIDENLVNPAVFAAADTQHWLCEALMGVDMNLLTQGKLKPIFEAVAQEKPQDVHLDYIQLRAALNFAGVRWSSLKPH